MKKYISLLILTLYFLNTNAQDEHISCSQAKIKSFQKQQKKKRADLASNVLMNQYDVHFYFLDIYAERNNTLTGGVATIGATVMQNGLDTFCFELNQHLTIDSVVCNNQVLHLVNNSDIHYAIFSNTQSQNTDLFVKIYYHGDASVVGGAAIGNGYSTGIDAQWGNEATWSLSEPFSAYEWFPCKQSLQDKADSVWVFVTTSDENKVGANGILEGIDTLANNKLRFRWKSHYPTDYYLISIAVAKYVDYTIYAHPAALNGDSIKIVNYVYDNPATLQSYKSQIDSNALVLEYFSDIMGIYPFYQEKYGHCLAPFGGGMEHQTMTSIGTLKYFYINSHELFHQWWGDHVTCKTWKDIFINEGFASYGEYLAYEHFRGLVAAQTRMNEVVHQDVLLDSFAKVYFTDTSDVNRIFDSRLTYHKGSAVIHTLRFILGDMLFFQSLKDFQTQFAFSTASIDDLHIFLENVTGLNLSNYFNQWIYGEGYPIYSGEYYSDGSKIYLKIKHVTSSPATPLFMTPLEIKCTSQSGDTTIKVNITQNINTFIIPSSKIIDSIEFDPNNWLLNKDTTVIKNPQLVNLSIDDVQLDNQIVVYPNPANDYIFIENLSNEKSTYQLCDIQGNVYQKGVLNKQAQFNLSKFSSGLYFLKIETSKGNIIKKINKL